MPTQQKPKQSTFMGENISSGSQLFKQKKISVGEDVEKFKPYAMLL